MIARLVFKDKVGSEFLIREGRLEEIDKYTFKFLDSEELKKNLGLNDGDIKVKYSISELSLNNLYLFLESDDLFKEFSLNPLFGKDNIRPEMSSLIRSIHENLNDIEKARFFNDLLSEQLNEHEKLIQSVGLALRNTYQMNCGNINYLKKVSASEEGYFFTRYIDDKLRYEGNTAGKTIMK